MLRIFHLCLFASVATVLLSAPCCSNSTTIGQQDLPSPPLPPPDPTVFHNRNLTDEEEPTDPNVPVIIFLKPPPPINGENVPPLLLPPPWLAPLPQSVSHQWDLPPHTTPNTPGIPELPPPTLPSPPFLEFKKRNLTYEEQPTDPNVPVIIFLQPRPPINEEKVPPLLLPPPGLPPPPGGFTYTAGMPELPPLPSWVLSLYSSSGVLNQASKSSHETDTAAPMPELHHGEQKEVW